MANSCPYHADHENRIKNLEVNMKEVQANQKSPAVFVAIVGLIGTVMATFGSIAGAVIVAYLKARSLL